MGFARDVHAGDLHHHRTAFLAAQSHKADPSRDADDTGMPANRRFDGVRIRDHRRSGIPQSPIQVSLRIDLQMSELGADGGLAQSFEGERDEGPEARQRSGTDCDREDGDEASSHVPESLDNVSRYSCHFCLRRSVSVSFALSQFWSARESPRTSSATTLR